MKKIVIVFFIISVYSYDLYEFLGQWRLLLVRDYNIRDTDEWGKHCRLVEFTKVDEPDCECKGKYVHWEGTASMIQINIKGNRPLVFPAAVANSESELFDIVRSLCSCKTRKWMPLVAFRWSHMQDYFAMHHKYYIPDGESSYNRSDLLLGRIAVDETTARRAAEGMERFPYWTKSTCDINFYNDVKDWVDDCAYNDYIFSCPSGNASHS